MTREEATRRNTMPNELKMCPFCGGDVRLDVAYSYFRDTVIYCDGCDMVFTLDDCSATKEQIAEAWNRRYGDGMDKREGWAARLFGKEKRTAHHAS